MPELDWVFGYPMALGLMVATSVTLYARVQAQRLAVADVGGRGYRDRMTVSTLNELPPGAVVAPGDPDWDAARRFHSGIGEPAVIVRASSVDDVRAALRYAAAERLDVMVRGGGHSAWGAVPGGLTIDLAALDDIDVDGTLVRVGGGATWGSVARALADRGLGVSSGDTASVGVGGLTLGGGIGWMVRAWGLAADQLVGAQLVTAGGRGPRGVRARRTPTCSGRSAAAAATSASSPASTSARTS